MKLFRLIDEYGYVRNEFRAMEYKKYLDGELYEIDAWESDISIPASYEFISNVIVKWDLCTHWEFIDKYYHICGGFGYVDFMRGMAFIVELAKMYVDGFNKECDEYKYLSKLNILEGCKIIEVDSKFI